MPEPEVCQLRLTAEEALRLPWIGIDPARVVIDAGVEEPKAVEAS